eukprot:TRINITY_DN37278_c0_g1_i2.p1 TRINITY_DN37278_c0_g1~~TRINITY_DN37278_c0_g1_i2.p1  ORF type:complete len:550 (+),score=164.50 TRINITY_DN37278_c0_g1_i2:229-1650(+)
MGMNMVWKLVKEPTHSVHVWTRNERKMRAYAEHVEQKTQRYVHQRQLLVDIPRFADVIFVSLANIRAVREVMIERDDALIYNAKPGTIVVDHSTVDLDATSEIAEIARARGVHYLDAPIAGSSELAQSGSLTVMVGGDQLAFRRVAKLMAKYAHCVEYMGESGSGTSAKMVHEAASAMHAVVSAETALLAKSLGVTNLDTMSRVMDASLGGSNMFRRNSLYFPEQFDARMKIGTSQSVSRCAKNLAILDEHVSKVGLSNFLPCTKVAQRVVRDCGEAGGHDADISSVLHFLNPNEPNMSVHWDVPVTDAAQNAVLRSAIEKEQYDAEAQEAPWSNISEFDTHAEPTTSSMVAPATGAPPRIDPSKLEELYSKAKPRMAAQEGSSAGRAVPKSRFQPVELQQGSERQSRSVRESMTVFNGVSQTVDKVFGKTSLKGIAMHQRSPGILGSGAGRMVDDAPDSAPAPASGPSAGSA